MKGVILAGGTGSRLMPLTKVTNKHLLSIYDKPMIHYPLNTLIKMGITEIMIVSGVEHCGHILQLLGSGKDFGVSISYRVQDQAGGIAQALSLAENFVGKDSVSVILGDNIFEDSFDVSGFHQGAKLFLKQTNTPERFGVAQIINNSIISIVEKPKKHISDLAVTGLYVYDYRVFGFIKELRPSARGELEITDVNNRYLQAGDVPFEIVHGGWSDAGTFESLFKAGDIARRMSMNTSIQTGKENVES